MDNLAFLCEAVENYKPLCISSCRSTTWVVFTDGAYEPSAAHPATVGGGFDTSLWKHGGLLW